MVVDIRESGEILPGEWAWFEARGSRVAHHPWSKWPRSVPAWDPDTTYLIVCARGIRSLAAVKLVPLEIRSLSLASGVLGLGLPREL